MMITMLRHAQTRGNLDSQYIGVTDESLAPEGIQTAKRAGGNHHVGKVYTSHLLRSIQTAELLYPKAELEINNDLGEMNFGRFEGQSAKTLAKDPAYMRWIGSNFTSACPNGERQDDFTKRCRNAFVKILKAETEAGSKAVHLMVHGGVIMALLSELATPKKDYFSWHSGFCGGYKLWYNPELGDRFLQVLQVIESPR